MDTNTIYIVSFLFVFGIALAIYVWKAVGNRPVFLENIPDEGTIREVLSARVAFFNRLADEGQELFFKRVVYFLKTTKISAEKGAVLVPADHILVAASATIPLFHFNQWAFENLDEVLIYKTERKTQRSLTFGM